jgi:fermentation-respiration switch protein FrsA (DUF1100 family)
VSKSPEAQTCEAAVAAAGVSSSSPSRKRTKRKRTWRRVLLEYSLLLLCVYFGGCLALAWNTVRPKLGKHNVTPRNYRLPFETIEFRSSDGTRLAGWFVTPSAKSKGTVILCHGVDSSAKEMLWEASLLQKRGFSALLFDFRGRGESDGALCTIGYRETDDLLAAVKYVRSRIDSKSLPIGVFGASQGGAVALLGTARSKEISAVLVESPFAQLDHAVDNHFRSVFGSFGATASTPVRWFGEAMIGRKCCDISPISEIGKIAPRPLMIIQDEEDALCPPTETEALYRAARGRKEIWRVPGAGHVRASDVAEKEFEKRVPEFFLRTLTK